MRPGPGCAGRRAALIHVLLAGSTCTILRPGRVVVVVEAATIPTTLPTDTTTIKFTDKKQTEGAYTGTIPTELGRFTKVTSMSLGYNWLPAGSGGLGKWRFVTSGPS